MNFNILTIFILLGALQGILLSIALFFSKNHQKRAYFLAFFLLILAYNGLETFGASVGVNLPLLVLWVDIFSPMYFFFGLGASLYLYISSFLTPTPLPIKVVLRYYAPVFIQISLRLALLGYAFFFREQRELINILNDWHFELTKLLNILVFWVYLYFSFQKYRTFRQETILPNPDEKALINKWLKSFLVVLFIAAFFWTVNIFALYFFKNYDIYYYYPVELVLVFLIYWIGFVSFHRTQIVYVIPPKSTPSSLENLAKDDIEKYIYTLKNAMEQEKLFLDPELNVSKLAKHIQINQKILSAILNQHLSKGFNEFINEYRVDEVKKKLLNSENQHLTISGIALESGFNSQATFQRVFKELTNTTPKEFLASKK